MPQSKIEEKAEKTKKINRCEYTHGSTPSWDKSGGARADEKKRRYSRNNE